jgi:hypothetical protein
MSGRRAKLIFIPLGVLLLVGVVAAQTLLLRFDVYLPHKKNPDYYAVRRPVRQRH